MGKKSILDGKWDISTFEKKKTDGEEKLRHCIVKSARSSLLKRRHEGKIEVHQETREIGASKGSRNLPGTAQGKESGKRSIGNKNHHHQKEELNLGKGVFKRKIIREGKE